MRALFLSWVFLVCCAVSGSAQVAEVSVSARTSRFSGKDLGNVGFLEQPLTLENGWGIVTRLDINSGDFLGHELSYAFDQEGLELSGENQGDVSVHQFFYDFLVHLTPRGTPVRPFVVAGLGFSSFFTPDAGTLQTSGTTKFGVNYGGGLKFKLNRRFGVRLDIRDHVTNKPNLLSLPDVTGKLHHLELSGGLSLLF